MILVGRLDSPFLRRVAVTMNHYGMAFERRSLAVFADFEAVTTFTPLGRVPALVLDDDDGIGGEAETLYDSQTIVDYLDEAAGPDRALTPASGVPRRRVLRVAAVALGVADKVVALNAETIFRAPGTTDPAMVRRLEAQVASGLGWLEARKPGPWFMGAAMTQADVTTACVVTHACEKRPELFPEGRFPALAALRARAEALDIFKASPYQEG